MNKELEQTHRSLLQVHRELFKRCKKAATREEFDALSNEAQEVLHRVNILQRQLFITSTAEIRARTTALAGIEIQVKDKLKQAQSAQELLKSLTGYLAKVDEIIDLAKAVAV